MISKSEALVHVFPELPPDIATGKPNVSLLEFMAVELPRHTTKLNLGGHVVGPAVGNTTATQPEIHTAAQVAFEEEAHVQERAIQMRAMVDAARVEAKLEARREIEHEIEERIQAERARVGVVCSEFIRDRQRYFADAEEQVVKLALAIAARVLHRESMMDPLLLAGAVRVAIAKVEDTSAVSLRVVPSETELWRSVFPPESEPVVEVLGDERLTAGEVILETVVGRVELGVAVQLEEIEQGFFDLLQRRPS